MIRQKQTVLIAGEDQQFYARLESDCRTFGFQTILAHDAKTTLATVLKGGLGLILVDGKMIAGEGLSVCDVLDRDEDAAKIPVIAFYGEASQFSSKFENLCIYQMVRSDHIWKHIPAVVTELIDIHSAVPNRVT